MDTSIDWVGSGIVGIIAIVLFENFRPVGLIEWMLVSVGAVVLTIAVRFETITYFGC